MEEIRYLEMVLSDGLMEKALDGHRPQEYSYEAHGDSS